MKILQCNNQPSFHAQLKVEDYENLFKPRQIKKLNKLASKIGNELDVIAVSVGVPYKCSAYKGKFLGHKYDIVIDLLMEGKEYTKRFVQSIKPNQERKPIPVISKFLKSLQIK